MVRSLPRGPRPARAADLSTSIAVYGFSGGGGWPWGPAPRRDTQVFQQGGPCFLGAHNLVWVVLMRQIEIKLGVSN